LLIPEQRQLFNYWLEKSRGRPMPERADISPAHIPRLLPFISIVEVDSVSNRYRVRLAGTRLREFYDQEITGRYVDELDWGDKQDYWMAAFSRIIEEGKPAQGIVRGPRVQKEHLVQFWLKLPLMVRGTGVGMILCYDTFVSAAEVDDNRESALATG
jgi:PAS domain